MACRAHRGEAGFAILVVFLLAAVIGIGLYLEMPRVVMESQRDREESLLDRGTQYQRGIQVFYRKFSRYPADMDALENTNNTRFLRRRYKDPMTGEDEWRLIHAAGPGIFTDSLVNAPPGAQPAQTADTSAGSAEETATPIWMQQRPSDRILAGGDSPAPPMPGMEETPPEQSASNSGAPAPGTVVTVNTAGRTPAESLAAMQAAQGQTGLDPGSPAGAALTLPSPVPTGPPPPGTIINPQGGNQPPMPIVPGMMVPVQQGQFTGTTTVTGTGGSQTTQPANPAIPMIQQLLTSPNPRAMATGVGQSPFGQQTLQAGGIAGVASKLESDSIKVYNDRTKYNEWEFIYDPRQDRTARAMSMQGQQGGGGRGGTPDTSNPLTGPGQAGGGGRGGQGGGGRGGQGGGGRGGAGVGPGQGGFGGPGGPFGGQPGFPGGNPQPQPGLGRGR